MMEGSSGCEPAAQLCIERGVGGKESRSKVFEGFQLLRKTSFLTAFRRKERQLSQKNEGKSYVSKASQVQEQSFSSRVGVSLRRLRSQPHLNRLQSTSSLLGNRRYLDTQNNRNYNNEANESTISNNVVIKPNHSNHNSNIINHNNDKEFGPDGADAFRNKKIQSSSPFSSLFCNNPTTTSSSTPSASPSNSSSRTGKDKTQDSGQNATVSPKNKKTTEDFLHSTRVTELRTAYNRRRSNTNPDILLSMLPPEKKDVGDTQTGPKHYNWLEASRRRSSLTMSLAAEKQKQKQQQPQHGQQEQKKQQQHQQRTQQQQRQQQQSQEALKQKMTQIPESDTFPSMAGPSAADTSNTRESVSRLSGILRFSSPRLSPPGWKSKFQPFSQENSSLSRSFSLKIRSLRPTKILGVIRRREDDDNMTEAGTSEEGTRHSIPEGSEIVILVDDTDKDIARIIDESDRTRQDPALSYRKVDEERENIFEERRNGDCASDLKCVTSIKALVSASELSVPVGEGSAEEDAEESSSEMSEEELEEALVEGRVRRYSTGSVIDRNSPWYVTLEEELRDFLASDAGQLQLPAYIVDHERMVLRQLSLELGLRIREVSTSGSIVITKTHSSPHAAAIGAHWDDPSVYINLQALASASEDRSGEQLLEEVPIRQRCAQRLNSISGLRRELLMDLAQSREGQRLSAVDEGVGGVYTVQGLDGRSVAMFKPVKEEKFVRAGLDAGEGAVRELASYLLDRRAGGFSSVPATALAQVSVSENQVARGAVQRFVSSKMGTMEDLGMPRDLAAAAAFVSVDEVHKVGVLDVRLFNTDRHSGNVLLLGDSPPYALAPIDHGCVLPSWFALAEARFDWMEWPQAKVPFAATTMAHIESLNAGEDAPLLRQLGIREECVTTLRICTLLLKIAAARGFTLFQIGSLIQRSGLFVEPSELELMIQEAAIMVGIPFVFKVNEYGEKVVIVKKGALSRRPPGTFFVHLTRVIHRKMDEIQANASAKVKDVE